MESVFLPLPILSKRLAVITLAASLLFTWQAAVGQSSNDQNVVNSATSKSVSSTDGSQAQSTKKSKPGFTAIGSDSNALKDAGKQGEVFDETLQTLKSGTINPWKSVINQSLQQTGHGQPLNPATGEARTAPTTSNQEQGKDLSLIDQQAAEFASRYLVGEAIELHPPQPSQLMSLGGTLPPVRLEASYTEPISLKDVLRYTIDNNLAIRIAQTNVDSYKWLTVGAWGNFLPNFLMNYQQQYLQGASLVGGVIPSLFETPNVSTSAGIQFFGFQGGRVLFNTLSTIHTYKAAKHAYTQSINDVLLNTAIGYFNLVRNQALLQIQVRAVEVSRTQLVINQQLETAGTGTKFQVLQAETQLATDEQNLLNQEVALRSAAIDLATLLNLDAGVNLLAVDPEIKKKRLIDPNLDIAALLNIACLNRPELKQYEHLRIAALRNIQVNAASLYPNFQFYASVAGNGATLGKTYEVIPGAFSPIAVNATPTASPLLIPPMVNSSNSTIPTINAVANGQPIYQGAEVYTPASIVDRQIRRSYTIGMLLNWNYPNAGIPTLGSIMSARALARQALLNCNQQLMTVLQQVRETYLTSQTAERQIEVTTKAVISAAEELRLARVRLANGVGTNLDVINAQRDFTTALVNKADAIIQFNIAQAQLLHDIGIISYDGLTSGHLVTGQLVK